MPVTTPARERTRREIEQQAMALFASRGYSATSLQDIATAAGCSKATVLYHFNSKPAVLAAVLEPSHVALKELLADVSALPAAAAQELAISRFVDLAVQFRGLVHVLQDVLPTIEETPELADLVQDGLRLTEFLAGSDDQLEIDIASFAINGLLGECRHPGERTDAELHQLCDTALHRLLRKPTRRP
ncbi:TetR family transcriptional regulator [Kribbella sp. VKM Ac-2527]|uniref:TetR family transcriptional regulator n=1 Tax=Kribbella caucasensis TaxID=2512215 RepID=A0A4R6JNU7_9ACTN|nr:TetR/AcrR family transcriptional regulator [Kribbella sp. VKM Ac-2527]TDO36426.1 TetR family transcriptional regulator [Kribbella sp. VKM Ac-2527]